MNDLFIEGQLISFRTYKTSLETTIFFIIKIKTKKFARDVDDFCKLECMTRKKLANILTDKFTEDSNCLVRITGNLRKMIFKDNNKNEETRVIFYTNRADFTINEMKIGEKRC